jgi:hypothetical protein
VTSQRATGVAIWIAGIITFGWLATFASGVLSGEGHPPLWYYLGGIVVIGSFVLAPIGVGAVLLSLRGARRQGSAPPRGALTALRLNLMFLLVAVSLWLWMWWAAARR